MSLRADVFMRDETGERRVLDVPDLLREVLLLREHLDVIAATAERPRGPEEHRAGIEVVIR
ncbi:MAG TPA: hypothetical protein VIU15_04475 [Streptomyces sp.]